MLIPKQKILFWGIFLTLLIATVGRLIPHPANMTPLAPLAILSGSLFNKRAALFVTMISLILSDSLLAYFHGYSAFGNWSVFTYTGFIAMILLAPTFKPLLKGIKMPIYVLLVTLAYWVWTNFGTWLLSGIYPHSLTGIATCYFAALPFLRNSMIGNFLYMLVFTLSLQQTMVHLELTLKEK